MKLSVITGGAGGMGVACAKVQGKKQKLLLVDVSQEKLDEAVAILAEEGITDVETALCDIGDRESVRELAQRAASLGEIDTVMHLAGVSQAVAPAEVVLKVNGVGVYNVIEEFFEVMGEGSNMITVNSLSTHLAAKSMNENLIAIMDNPQDEAFYDKLLGVIKMAAEKAGADPAGLAYAFSKYFSWRYSRRNVRRFWSKGIRLNTVTPGIISTPLGLIADEGSERMKAGMAIDRFGTPDEMAAAICFLASDMASDITGVELPVDGGWTCIFQFDQIEA